MNKTLKQQASCGLSPFGGKGHGGPLPSPSAPKTHASGFAFSF